MENSNKYLTAKELFKLTKSKWKKESNVYDRVVNELTLSIINDCIKVSKKDGYSHEYSFSSDIFGPNVCDDIIDQVNTNLRDLGYIVSYSGNVNGLLNHYTVSWDLNE